MIKTMKSSSAIALVLGLSALSGAWSQAHAQVATTAPVVVSGAGTRLDITTSGTPIINIATPRADGTSYNVFSRLNVGQEGLILNNSQAIGQSQIGGIVLANQNLRVAGAVPARLILNEVVNGTRSDLNGAIEVFGSRAGVVIANPAGITCDGCGFINISRASLSTGRPTFDGSNAFTGLQVNGGSVIIQGRGLSGGDVDFFDIVTGSASINANLYARDLVISGGAANFNYGARTASQTGGLSGVVIDSSVLGGMYANRIRLIGSGTGVGINLRGAVSALSGGVSIATDGAITVRNVDAGGDIAIASRGSSVRVEEYVTSGGSTIINAAGDIDIANNQAAVDEATVTETYYNYNYDYNGYYDQDYSQSSYESTYSPIALAAASIDAGGVVSLTSGGNILHNSRGGISGNVVIASAANDIIIGGGSGIYGGDIALDAGRDVSLTATTQYVFNSNYTPLGNGLYSSSVSSNLAVTGADIDAGGTFIASAGRDVSLESAMVNAGGIASLSGGRDVAIFGIGSTATTTNSWKTSKRVTGNSVETVSIFDGSSIHAGGALFVNAREELDISGSSLASNQDIRLGAATGTVSIAGSDISAFGDILITGQNILVTGSLNSSSFDETIRTVKRGFLSKKTTTAVTSNDIETIFASTIAGNNITLASAGDVNILDSNIVSELATDILAGGSIVISSVPTASSYYNSFKVKKSGFSIGGSGLFLGVSKSSQITTLDTVSNAGSVIGAARGNVSLSAGVLGLRTAASGTSGALLIKGSEVSAPGLISLSGDNVAIENNFDSANSTSIFRQSSFGLSINFYENVSGAVNSVSGLGARINASGQGTAGTAISAASETLRSVAAVTTALTNTAGVTASIGFSSSRRSSAAQEIGVVASNIAGGSVDIRGTDVRVAGSTITAINDLTIVAQRDAIFQSAQNRLATQDSSSSSSFGVGATLGVGIVGGVSASAFVNFGTSSSNGSSLSAAQFNSQIVSGGLLSLTSGQDTSLRGAVVQGRDVNASIGRNLLIESLQDSASSTSNSYGFNLGLTYGGGAGFGFNGGINYGYGTSTGRRVSEQSSLIARGGALNANVVGSTNLIGGVIAALDSGRADTGRLTLRTGSLITSNIADSASSLNYGFGFSINFNDIFDQGFEGANYPVFDGYYGSTAFAQSTRATIGAGSLVVGNGVLPTALNRDITQSQVVTKDRATGFSLYIDPAAAIEVYNLVGGLANGRTGNSIILQGVNALRTRPLGLIQDTINEVRAFGSTLGDPATRNDSQIEKLFNQLGANFLPKEVAIAQAQRQFTDDFRAINLAKGVPAAALELELASPQFQVVAREFATLQVEDYRLNERPVLTARATQVAEQINSAPINGSVIASNTTPPDDTIIVTACPRSGCDVRTNLAHNAAAALGNYYNSGSSFRRTVIDAGIGVASGGPAGYIFGEVAGAVQSQILPARAQELAGNLSTAINVGIDSFFQGRSFGTVGTENANRDNTFQSQNATTGSGLIVQAIPGARAVFRGRGGGSSSSTRRAERPRTCSFHGDTFVKTLMGLTPIKDIKAGTDQVWARDAETGEMGYRLVEAQYSNPYDVTVKVSIRDAETGKAQTLVSNKIHPFFVQLPEGIAAPPSSEGHSYSGDIKRGAWVDASNLKAGYRLLNDDGSWAEVTGLTVENAPLTAYNLTVSGFHTYFVTANASAEPVWVHNDCFGDAVFDQFGVDRATFHRDVKPDLLHDFSADLRRTGTRNPDVGINDAGNIIFRDPRTKRVVLVTDVPASSYGR